MKIAFIDCYSGISGDMFLGALADLAGGIGQISKQLERLPLDGWEISARKVNRGGISAIKVDVSCDDARQKQRSYPEILELIDGARFSARAAGIAKKAFQAIAEAEAAVHNTSLEQVHFHEIGAVDSIIDICGVAVAIDDLSIDKIFTAAVSTGCGEVETRHGCLPVPAPATVRLLRGLQTRGLAVPKELTTPTGAALIKTLAVQTEAIPAMIIENAGYGAGDADLPGRSNTLRITIGDDPAAYEGSEKTIWILETNIDDMTGEEIGFLFDDILSRGALDVYTTAISMKKNRPAVKFSVLCSSECKESLAEYLMDQSSTLGVRCWPVSRNELQRQTVQGKTRWGMVKMKLAGQKGHGLRLKPEYEECSKIARAEGLPFREVYEALVEDYRNQKKRQQ